MSRRVAEIRGAAHERATSAFPRTYRFKVTGPAGAASAGRAGRHGQQGRDQGSNGPAS